MSTKGVYTALSGAIAQSARLDTIANNLANVNTPSFKKDQQVFREYLTANEKMQNNITIPRIPATVESFYDHQGGDKSYVDSAGTYSDWTQGAMKSTGNPLDVGIDGGGFFEVDTPAGVRLTRTGAFKIDGNGLLATKDGHPVMRIAPEGTEPSQRVIRIEGSGPVNITDQGDLVENGNVVARLSVVDVAEKDTLQKQGASLFDFKANATPQKLQIANPNLKQGFLEMSNVNIVQEMTDMIATTRLFESTQKAISAYDSMNEKLVNQVGTLR